MQLQRRRWQRGFIGYAEGARVCVGLWLLRRRPPQLGSSTAKKKNRYVEVPGCSPPSSLKAGLHLHCGVPPTKKKNTSYVEDGGLLRRRCMIREAAFVKTKVPHLNSSMKTPVFGASNVEGAGQGAVPT